MNSYNECIDLDEQCGKVYAALQGLSALQMLRVVEHVQTCLQEDDRQISTGEQPK